MNPMKGERDKQAQARLDLRSLIEPRENMSKFEQEQKEKTKQLVFILSFTIIYLSSDRKIYIH